MTATDGCASTPSSPRGVSITGPTALLGGSIEIDRGESATLSVTLTGTAPWNVTWLDGFAQNGIAVSPVTRSVSPLVTTTYFLDSVADAACTGTVSGSATVAVYPLPPSSMTATSSNTSVAVSWPASLGAVSYAVERAASRSGSFQTAGTSTTLTLNDNVPAGAAPVTYVYRVRAVDAIGTWSRASTAPMDFATTASVLFAEAVTTGWEIKASHVTELQRAVDALRTASGLAALFGSAPSLAGAPIAASDFTAMIAALNGARSVWGLPPFGYAGVPAPGPGEMVYAAHVTQLRDGVR